MHANIVALWNAKLVVGKLLPLIATAVVVTADGRTAYCQSCRNPPPIVQQGVTAQGWQRCSTIPYCNNPFVGNAEEAMNDGVAAWASVANSRFGITLTPASCSAAAQNGLRFEITQFQGTTCARAAFMTDGTGRTLRGTILYRDHSPEVCHDYERSDFADIIYKWTLHEIGHTFGLGDLGGISPGTSIMNQLYGINDEMGNIANYITSCDANSARANGPACGGGEPGRLECSGNGAECEWNPYGVGNDECEEGDDYESCGDGLDSGNDDDNGCVPMNLSSGYCDAMCFEPYPGWYDDINCNGWDDNLDCDFYYGECPPPIEPTFLEASEAPFVAGAVAQILGLCAFAGLWRQRQENAGRGKP